MYFSLQPDPLKKKPQTEVNGAVSKLHFQMVVLQVAASGNETQTMEKLCGVINIKCDWMLEWKMFQSLHMVSFSVWISPAALQHPVSSHELLQTPGAEGKEAEASHHTFCFQRSTWNLNWSRFDWCSSSSEDGAVEGIRRKLLMPSVWRRVPQPSGKQTLPWVRAETVTTQNSPSHSESKSSSRAEIRFTNDEQTLTKRSKKLYLCQGTTQNRRSTTTSNRRNVGGNIIIYTFCWISH